MMNLSRKTAALVALAILTGAALTACCPMCPMHKAQKAQAAGCPLPRGAFIENLDNWHQYFNGGVWEIVYKTLKEVTPLTPDGTTQILGDDIKLLVTTTTTNPPEKAVVEAHEKYIDVQMVIQGVDHFRWWPVTTLKARSAYDPAKDIIFYEVPAAPMGELVAHPGTFAVFMPFDAHSTAIYDPATGGAPSAMRKAVVKIRASLVCPRAK